MCYFPLSIKPDYKQRSITNSLAVKVGCGKCKLCRQARSRQWIVRLKSELSESISAHFITLTYDEDTVPKTSNNLQTLDKKDFQKFMKRMRKYHATINKKSVLKYYAVGEYGSKTQRPHYHAILFNADPDSINKIWGKGHTHYGEVTAQSIAYVTGYTDKLRLSKILRHETDDRENEFNLISQGIGKSLVNEKIQHYINFSKLDTIKLDGDNYTIPRYVKDKLNIGDDIKEDIKEKKQKFYAPINNMTREEMRNEYARKLQQLKKDKLNSFTKQHF